MSIDELVAQTLDGIGVPVWWCAWPGGEDYPPAQYITYQEMLEQGEEFTDDEEDITGHYVMVDIWSATNPRALCKDVKKRMRAAGFTRRDEQDIYEADTRTHHRALVFVYMEEV